MRALLAAAEARASEISSQAASKARDRGARAATADRAARMLEAIDLMEKRLEESFDSLRAQAKSLLGALEKAHPASPNGKHAAGEDWTGDLDEAMAELLFFDELPTSS